MGSSPAVAATPRIDFYSDTLTKPSRAMRLAMADAEVGDEQKREDPTTNRLQERVAAMLGKEAAVFLPSGVMCNTIAFRCHCQPGDELILDQSYHPVNYEVGAPAALVGVQCRTITSPRGIFTVKDVEAAIRPRGSKHYPRSSCVSIEQTSNMGGGAVWPLEQVAAISALARERGLTLHMDGARLLNAVVKSGVAADRWGALVDSVWIDFSKGLGAPVGAVLAGSQEMIEQAWRWKHQFGGAMRQSGILAAGCLYALDHNVARLADDHDNAALLAAGLAKLPGFDVEPVETNMVFFSIERTGISVADFEAAMLARGIRMSGGRGLYRLRAVLHLDVTRAMVEEAVAIIGEIVAGGVAKSGATRGASGYGA